MTTKKNHSWTFLTNHSHVLCLINNNPNITIRDIAIKIGITERAVLNILSDLTETAYLTITKIGRNNHYEINKEKRLRHPIENHCTIDDFLGPLIAIKP
ncbi:ArsR family transcriptional regulator [Francisella halioticida]|uniref:helix-turn-helix transcriptional regulator n=1 Tax=Francisella halioticida TaxID=549298 RepID=UPI001AF119AA|nr:winged helix-turn-helix transcriptional regulator [Francisella halioticida]BCD90937.1 ArsR family transcriptional regulator [Francisella halioticida]